MERDPSIKPEARPKMIETEASNWLNTYKEYDSSPEGCAVRFLLAKTLFTQAQRLPNQKSAEAQKLYADAEGLLKYEKYRGLVLTTAGEQLARNIMHRHQLLTDFLKLLGIDEDVIYHDVEGMEHHISSPTLHAIETLTCQLQRQPALLAKIRKTIDAH